MSASTASHTYTIKEASALTGLPASTLRYYESIGVIAPIGRGASSGHRVYDESDLDQLMWIACLAATGMSVSDMREYVANADLGASAAAKQIDLLKAQERRLQVEAKQLAVRTHYVRLKVAYWQAVEAGDAEQVERIASQAAQLALELKESRTP